MDVMIIAILDDGGVMVHGTLADAQREHEGIDVEYGAVLFYDAHGQRLRPRFTQPNVRSSFVVTSGQFDLQVAGDARDELTAALDAASYLEPTPIVASLARLRDLVTGAN
ncbi:MAG: hypothetical protein WA208_21570 [Thermoanaerobaculia bacterium]